MTRAPVALLLCAVLLTIGSTAAAQVRPKQQKPAQQRPDQQRPTAREQVLQRLRSMTTTEGPDTTVADTMVTDTLIGDTLRAPRAPLQPDTAGRPAGMPVTSAPDTIMQRLLQLPGYSPTEYAGRRAQFQADSGVLYVTGDSVTKATVTREGQTIVADSLLTFDRNTQVACGYGQPVLTGPESEAPLTSRLVCYNTESQIGMALDAQTEISQGANWIARGDLATRGEDVYMHDAAFTDCNLEVPHYHFSAGTMKVVNGDVLVARNVTLNFGDVPVFWLPFLMQSMKQGRRSGILMPRFSINDIFRRNSRYNRRIEDIGFYWAVNDYLGAEVAMDWFANNYTSLRGSFDYRWLEKFFNGAVTYRQFWRTEGGREMTLSTSNNWEPTERTRLNVSGNYASSGDFVRDNTFDPRELNRSIDSNAGVSHRFNWGTINTSASRKQDIGDGRVNMTLPQVSLNLNPVTIFPELTNPRWYNNITWNGNASTRFESSDVAPSPNERDHSTITSNGTSTFTIGNFSVGSSFNLTRKNLEERELLITDNGEVVDTIPARPDEYRQDANWNASLSYQQRLIGTSTFTPSLSIGGRFVRSTVDEERGTDGKTVSAPLRVSFGANLKTDLFGFWPGIGPVERIRHRLSPSIGYSYSPSTTPDSLQRLVFGVTETGEQNTLRLSLNQTIEGKLRRRRGEAGDTLAQDTAAADTLSLDPSRPRRIQQGDKITILGLNTSAIVYDFVAARQGRGIQTMQLTNNITSDVLRGLQVTLVHELFEEVRDENGEILDDRRFSPHLRSLSTSFSLSSSSSIFRKLGLGGGDEDAPVETGTAPTPLPEGPEAGPPIDRSRPEEGLIGTRRREEVETTRSPVGAWNASFDIMLLRPRERDAVSSFDGSMIRVNLNFQPTQNWNVYWRTAYSFTEGDFTDHILTLTRQLHDWDANFDFIKAQNGNFSFSFRVQLRANPDIKFDYEQRDNERSSF